MNVTVPRKRISSGVSLSGQGEVSYTQIPVGFKKITDFIAQNKDFFVLLQKEVKALLRKARILWMYAQRN